MQILPPITASGMNHESWPKKRKSKSKFLPNHNVERLVPKKVRYFLHIHFWLLSRVKSFAAREGLYTPKAKKG